MKLSLRYMLLFSGSVIAGVYLHEIGHAVAGWVNGVAVVPTPAKEYILQSQLDWSKEIWIALGGVIGTTVAALAAAFYLWRQPCPDREAILAGAFLPVGVYTLRFVLVGRGHDATEWQAAQTALNLPIAGHAIDLFFLCLLIAGLAVWVIRLHPRLSSVLRLVSMTIMGIILLISLQAGNNAVLDRVFPRVTMVNLPAELDAR
jgi:hypothetical protein